jgi:TRAP-type C4-dicarboxylate transport system substrate-binding protein
VSPHAVTALADTIARAIMAAEKRGEEREREAVKAIAAKGVKATGTDAWANGYRCAAADIEASIRNRGAEQ